MRQARVTWPGALHHIMNRGLNKQRIFLQRELKIKYIEMMSEKSKKYGVTIYAYCIMDNHFHFALENTSGNLSNFMKSLNGHYGQYYRKFTNSKGYVFEDRFKSTLIQDESYLTTLIMYIFQNPERSGYVSNPFEYRWSSVSEYFRSNIDSFIDKEMVEEFFLSKVNFERMVSYEIVHELEEQFIGKTRFLGDKINCSRKSIISNKENLISLTKKTFDNTTEKIIKKFELDHAINLYELDIRSDFGKKTRNQLLVRLREETELTYKEIHKLKIFDNLKLNYLRYAYFKNKK